MKPTQMLAAAALTLAAGTVQAYQILESRYHVEVTPGTFQDQLVLKCDNGKTITVPWEAKLYEACGEDLYGNTSHAAKPEELAQERQKEVMLSRMREQYGNIDDRYVQFQSGPGGVSMQFQPPMRDIIKRYEICRKQTKNSPTCVSERDQALAALSAPATGAKPAPAAAPEAAAAEAVPAPAPEAKPATAKGKKTKAAAVPAEAAAAPSKRVIESAPQPSTVTQAPKPEVVAPKPAPADAPKGAPDQQASPTSTDPASADQKIADDYAWCLRAKPKFECDQARARAQTPPAKPKTAKPASKAKGGTEAGAVKAVYSPAQ
jgi:hypothetical protein